MLKDLGADSWTSPDVKRAIAPSSAMNATLQKIMLDMAGDDKEDAGLRTEGLVPGV